MTMEHANGNDQKGKYKELYEGLKRACERHHIKVEEVMDLKDYAGMNDVIAGQLGYHMPKKTIYIDCNLSTQGKYETLKHEMIERKLMSKGVKYWKAHCEALRREKYGQ